MIQPSIRQRHQQNKYRVKILFLTWRQVCLHLSVAIVSLCCIYFGLFQANIMQNFWGKVNALNLTLVCFELLQICKAKQKYFIKLYGWILSSNQPVPCTCSCWKYSITNVCFKFERTSLPQNNAQVLKNWAELAWSLY